MVPEKRVPLGNIPGFLLFGFLPECQKVLFDALPLFLFRAKLVGKPHDFLGLLRCLCRDVPDHLPEFLFGFCLLLKDGFYFLLGSISAVPLCGKIAFQLPDLDC